MTDYGFKKYGQFSPTQFDGHIEIDGRENWLVMPVTRNRDSGCLEESNFQCFLRGLGGEGRSVEVHRFGHWGPGWFEIIIVSPGAKKKLEAAYDMAGSLQDYPILDEADHSERELEAEQESWDNSGASDFRRTCEGVLEGELNAGDADEPVDPAQRWCKNWGLDTHICGCGDCIETRGEWLTGLLEKLESFDNDQLRKLADGTDMTVEHHPDGVYFKFPKELDTASLIEEIDCITVKSEEQVAAIE